MISNGSTEWTREDECDPFAKFIKRDPLELSGPVDHHNASHWIEYDPIHFTVETWCSFGPNKSIKLKTRIRPMVESEIIHTKLEGHSRDAVLKAYGVQECNHSEILIPKNKTFFSLLRSIFK